MKNLIKKINDMQVKGLSLEGLQNSAKNIQELNFMFECTNNEELIEAAKAKLKEIEIEMDKIFDKQFEAFRKAESQDEIEELAAEAEGIEMIMQDAAEESEERNLRNVIIELIRREREASEALKNKEIELKGYAGTLLMIKNEAYKAAGVELKVLQVRAEIIKHMSAGARLMLTKDVLTAEAVFNRFIKDIEAKAGSRGRVLIKSIKRDLQHVSGLLDELERLFNA